MRARTFVYPLLGCLVPAVATLLPGCGGDRTAEFRSAMEERIAASGAEVVGVYYRDLGSGDSVTLAADTRLHAASTMKIPVMIQVFRDADAGWFSLDDSLVVTDTFRSIVDESPYRLSSSDDGDSTLYRRIGQRASIRELTELMITVSSNLAANMLIERVGAQRAEHSMRELGADSIAVLRGVEDIKAYEAGLNNTTTARDLGIILTAIAEGRAADPEGCRAMIEILSGQRFAAGIPAGLPANARVAHKTGTIARINHDAALVELPDGTRFVLIVLTSGIEDTAESDRLIADLSQLVHAHATGG